MMGAVPTVATLTKAAATQYLPTVAVLADCGELCTTLIRHLLSSDCMWHKL